MTDEQAKALGYYAAEVSANAAALFIVSRGLPSRVAVVDMALRNWMGPWIEEALLKAMQAPTRGEAMEEFARIIMKGTLTIVRSVYADVLNPDVGDVGHDSPR